MAIVILFVPGLVHGLVRRRLQGFRYDDLTLDARLAQALVVSALFDSVYLIFAGAWLSSVVLIEADQVFVSNPVSLGFAVLLFAILVPAAVTALVYSPYRLRRNATTSEARPPNTPSEGKWPLRIERRLYYESVPTAWDWGATKSDRRMVRVTRPDGTYLGGLFGPGSYVSTYPEPRDIFISHQYHLEADGTFGAPALNCAGIWTRISDEHVVEFFYPSYTDEEREELERG